MGDLHDLNQLIPRETKPPKGHPDGLGRNHLVTTGIKTKDRADDLLKVGISSKLDR